MEVESLLLHSSPCFLHVVYLMWHCSLQNVKLTLSCPLTPYRRLWLFSACAYKLRLQETMRLTDNVRLTSGIIAATPSMRKHVIAKRVIVNVEQTTRTEMTSAPVSDDSIFLHESVIHKATIFPKGYGLQEQERLYKFDKKQETLMIEMLWLCSNCRWNSGWTCA